MITKEQANYIAYDWIDAWNNRDIERIMSHYSTSIMHTSPLTVLVSGSKDFTIKGRRLLRQYFKMGLRSLRNVRFEIIGIMKGVNSLSIVYRTTKNKKGIEVMFFNDTNKVYRSYAYYNDG